MNIWESILVVYPKAKDCKDGHIGAVQKDYVYEQDDDRAELMRVERCGWCDMPVGEVDYATLTEEQEFTECNS